MVKYTAEANEHMSFLEMLDELNEALTRRVRIRSRSTMTAVKESAVHAVS